MTFNDKIQDEIERYSNDQMNDAEKGVFNQKCQTDKAYQEHWNSYVLLNAAGKAIEKKRFEQYDIELAKEKKQKILIWVSILLLLTSLLCYFAFFYNTSISNEEQIFVEQFETPDKSIIFDNDKISTQKTSSLTQEDDIKSLRIAIDNFYAGEYNKSIRTLQELTKYNPALLRANFYIGAAQLELHNYQEALEEFEHILDGLDNNGNEDLLEETYWYKSLTLVALQRKKEAIEHLELLIAFSNKYETKANNLIRELNDSE
jgi:tetratricopeptide (TPR) repeat protein